MSSANEDALAFLTKFDSHTSSTVFLYALYQALLRRTPDPAGLAFWEACLARGASWTEVYAAVAASPEAQASGGASATHAGVLQQDLSGPVLTSVTPSHLASNVSPTTTIFLHFDENIVAGSGIIYLSNGVSETAISANGTPVHRFVGASDTRAIAIGDSQLSISGHTATLTLNSALLNSESYSLYIAPGVLQDAAGNAYAGIRDSTSLRFAVAQPVDTTAPILLASTPADDVSAVAVGANIVLVFSETVQAGSGNFVLHGSASDLITLAATDGAVSYSGNTVTINPSSDLLANSTYYLTIDSGAVKDLSNNGFAGISSSSQLNFSSTDTIAPHPTLSSSAATPLRLGFDTSLITFSLGEASSNFTASDVIVSGGSLSGFGGSGASYSATITMSAGQNSGVSVIVAAGVYTDAAGNLNTAATTLHLPGNTIRPTVSADLPLTIIAGQTPTITFTLSEGTADFASDDIIFSGGVLSNFSGSGNVYTATYTPASNTAATVSLDIAADSFHSTALNGNAALHTSVVVDTSIPHPTVTTDFDSPFRIGLDSALVNFNLGEASSNFTASDVIVSGGSLSGFGGSGASYSATITMNANSSSGVSVILNAGAYSDAAGNLNTAASTLFMSGNTVRPTVSVDLPATIIAGQTPTLTFTLSEASTNFGSDDIVLSGGSLSNFSGSGALYTATYTPDTNANATLTLDIAANAFRNSSLNFNAAYSTSATIDTHIPHLQNNTPALGAEQVALAANLVFTFDEAVQAGSGNFVIHGSLSDTISIAATDSAVTISGNTVTINPSSDLLANGNYYVTVDAGAIKDLAGNSYAGFSSSGQLSFVTIDTIAPHPTLSSDNASALRVGFDTALISFNLGESSTNFTASDIIVSGGTLSGFGGSGFTYSGTITMVAGSTSGVSVIVQAGVYTDAAGNLNTAASTLHISGNTLAPTVSTDLPATILAGQTPTITFTLSEGSTTFGSDDIVFSAGSLSNFSGSGTVYTATYTPASNTDTTISLDIAAGSFTSAALNGNTAYHLSSLVDTHVPVLQSSTPANAVDQIAVGANLVFTYDENLVANSGNIILSASGDIRSIAVTDSQVSISGGVLTINPSTDLLSDRSYTLSFASGVLHDIHGNSAASASLSFTTTDTIAPFVVSMLPDLSTLKVGQVAHYTITMSESVSGFSMADISVSSGTLSNFNGSGSVYTVDYTPPVNTEGSANLHINASTFDDLHGNANAAFSPISVTLHTLAPTVTISSDTDSLIAGAVAHLSFSLSSSASDFIASDISVAGGTLSALTGSGTSYTATFTPNGLWTSPATIDVASGTFTDANGNTNTAATQYVISIDTAPPTATISGLTLNNDSGVFSDDFITNIAGQTISGSYSGLGAGETIQVSLDSGIHYSDATATAGAWELAGVALSGTGTMVVRITDTAGNHTFGAAHSYNYDTTAPAASLAARTLDLDSASDSGVSSTDNITNDNTPTINIGITELGNLVAGDIVQVLDGSTVVGSYTVLSGDLTANSWNRSSLPITVSSLADGSHTLTARISDLAGNTSAATTSSLSITIDTLAPTMLSSVPANGATGVALNANTVLNFSEAIAFVTGSISIYKVASPDVIFQTFNASDSSGTWIVSNDNITFDPSSIYQQSESYYILIGNSVITDIAGNAFLGISSTTALRYTGLIA